MHRVSATVFTGPSPLQHVTVPKIEWTEICHDWGDKHRIVRRVQGHIKKRISEVLGVWKKRWYKCITSDDVWFITDKIDIDKYSSQCLFFERFSYIKSYSALYEAACRNDSLLASRDDFWIILQRPREFQSWLRKT